MGLLVAEEDLLALGPAYHSDSKCHIESTTGLCAHKHVGSFAHRAVSGMCGTQVGDLGMAGGNSTAVCALCWGASRAITTIVPYHTDVQHRSMPGPAGRRQGRQAGGPERCCYEWNTQYNSRLSTALLQDFGLLPAFWLTRSHGP